MTESRGTFERVWNGRELKKGEYVFDGLLSLVSKDADKIKTPCGATMQASTYRTAELLLGERAAELYLMTLCSHIDNVKRFATKWYPSISLIVQSHDASKFMYEEFVPYCWYWNTDRSAGDYDQMSAQYDAAWEHHLRLNPHHWDFWVFDGHPAPMPQEFVFEMICDWHGASKSYTGSWDMCDWLESNMDRMVMHARTREILGAELKRLGYVFKLGDDAKVKWSLTKEL